MLVAVEKQRLMKKKTAISIFISISEVSKKSNLFSVFTVSRFPGSES